MAVFGKLVLELQIFFEIVRAGNGGVCAGVNSRGDGVPPQNVEDLHLLSMK